MLDFALGELGLLPDVFWGMTWPELERATRGYHIRESRQWERTRELLLQQANLNRDPKQTPRPYKAEKYMPLLTDPPKKELSDLEGLRAFRERMTRTLKKSE